MPADYKSDGKNNNYLKIEIINDSKTRNKSFKAENEKKKSEMLYGRIKTEAETKYYINKTREALKRLQSRQNLSDK